MPAARGPSRDHRDDDLRHESDQTLHFEDVQSSRTGRVDGVRRLAAGVLIAGPAANTLVTTGAERPAAVLRRRSVAGEQDATHIGAHPGVVERTVQLVHGVRTERVAHLRPVEGDADDAFAGPGPFRTVVCDVGEVEASDLVPLCGVEQLRNLGMWHAWENKPCACPVRHPGVALPSTAVAGRRRDRGGSLVNPSTAQARVLVDELVRNTVSHVVLSPGSRNAPLSFALHDAAMAGRLTLHVRIDERSAAFLALGIAARTGRPVALVCTSGTAAANFHPAVLEADRAGVPLIVLTADRPPELRAAGANQVIDQRGLYGPAVRYFDELAVAERRPGQNAYWRSQICRAWNAAYGEWRCGPVHLNIPFREPLVPDGKDDPDDWPEPLDGRPQGARWTELPDFGALPSSVVPSARHGLVVACDAGVRAAGEWAELHGWPVVSETGGLGLGGTTAIA